MDYLELPGWIFTFDWESVLDTYGNLSPLVPILVVMAESFLPAVPLTAIVAWNIAAYGVMEGSLFSWIGNCLGCTVVFWFWRLILSSRAARFAAKHQKVMKARRFVNRINRKALFLIIMMPFTPSSFMNFAFGASDYHPLGYLITLYCAKTLMIAFLALIGRGIVLSAEEPLYIPAVLALLGVLWLISRKVFENEKDTGE